VTTELENLLNMDIEKIMTLKPREIKKMTFSDDQIKSIVRTYYRIQDMRKVTFNQTRAFKEDARPHLLVNFIGEEMKHLEDICGSAMDAYSGSKKIGMWARSIHGIGPKIASGLMSYIDIAQCPVVSHIWRYAGLDPTMQWLNKAQAEAIYEEVVGKRGIATQEQLAEMSVKCNRNPLLFVKQMTDLYSFDEEGNKIAIKPTRERQLNVMVLRPWNAELKTLCWKIGESFTKVSGNPDAFYGKILAIRKAYETDKNEKGEYAEAAKRQLEKFNIQNKEVRETYESGKLTPGHIFARSKRYAVKIFLSHYHAVAYELYFGEKPPKPFAIEHLGHAHEIMIPNWPMTDEGETFNEMSVQEYVGLFKGLRRETTEFMGKVIELFKKKEKKVKKTD
jgi:hypothetical protein